MGIRQLMEPDSLEEDAEKMIFPSSFMRKRDGKNKLTALCNRYVTNYFGKAYKQVEKRYY